MISKELQTGKAGEHFVCFDLIMQGYNAFLADQGLPFDIIVEENGLLKTIQVKSASKLFSCGKAKDIYRYGLRVGRGGKSVQNDVKCDFYAFVALDIKSIAYIPSKEMMSRNGMLKITMDFKSRDIKYKGRVYSNGTIRKPEWGKYLQDYNVFKF